MVDREAAANLMQDCGHKSCLDKEGSGLGWLLGGGVALAVLDKLVDRGEITSSDRVVIISTAHGLKFTEFKVRYHERQIDGLEFQYANTPIELPDDIGKIQEAVEKKLDSIPVS